MGLGVRFYGYYTIAISCAFLGGNQHRFSGIKVGGKLDLLVTTHIAATPSNRSLQLVQNPQVFAQLNSTIS